MSDIKVRGFVNKGATKESAKGKFAVFTLAEGQKQKDGTYVKAYFNVSDFKNEEAPADGSRVEVAGYMKVRKYGLEGRGQSLDIVAESIEILSPPREGAGIKTAEVDADPFDLG